MPSLSAAERRRLPDSAFAHVGARGRRILPIHDAAHVRNALARFNRTAFAGEEERERARTRLLAAARRFGIVPVGFISGQMRALAEERARLQVEVEARTRDRRRLPTGRVAFLFSDVEDSTGLLGRLGDGWAEVLAAVRAIHRDAIAAERGHEVDARADEHFAAFAEPAPALRAALAVTRAMAAHRWPGGRAVRVRLGLHVGRAQLSDEGYVGLDVHLAARVCSAAHGGQILVSAAAAEALGDELPAGVGLRAVGSHRLRGIAEPSPLVAVEAPDLPLDERPPRGPAPDASVVRDA